MEAKSADSGSVGLKCMYPLYFDGENVTGKVAPIAFNFWFKFESRPGND